MLMGMICLAGCSFDKNGNEQIIEKSVDATEIVLSTEIPEMETGDLPVSDNSNEVVYGGAAYTWEEITVIIPKMWENKFVIKEQENGFSIYQIASNEIEAESGLLCSVYRDREYRNQTAGEVLLAYTNDGELYYMQQPTDVTCYTEDESIAAEYMDMMSYVDWIAGSMQIEGENVHYDANQYAIAVSSLMPLEEHHLINLTDNELWIARNEIYARHGKIFKNEYLNSYFHSCSWYQEKEGKNDVSERELNEVELSNLNLIIAAEKDYEIKNPYPKQFTVGELAEDTLFGTEGKQKILYKVEENGEWEYTCTLTIDGKTYDVAEYVTIDTPIEDAYFITDISRYDERLEIAILDNGPSEDPVTHFFQYDGELYYIGAVSGFPFQNYANNYLNGFTGQNSVMGTGQVDLIETAYIDAYYWYDTEERSLKQMERFDYAYRWFNAHELFVDIPLYYTKDVNAPTRMINAQKEVYFISTDGKEWILVRGKDGIEGYIHIENGQITNIGRPAEEVFSELYFFG